MQVWGAAGSHYRSCCFTLADPSTAPPALASLRPRGHPAEDSQDQRLLKRALTGVYETFNKAHSKLGMALWEMQPPAQGLLLADGEGQLLSSHPGAKPTKR